MYVVDPAHEAEAIRLCTFPNPDYESTRRRMEKAAIGSQMRRKLEYRLHHTPQEIRLWDRRNDRVGVPRGLRAMSGTVPSGWTTHAVAGPVLKECRPLPDLREYQAEAVEVLASMREGILHAPTGSGKTMMAMHLIARINRPAIVLVPTLALLDQWVTELRRFWPDYAVGRIGEGECIVPHGGITVCSVATLALMVKRGDQPGLPYGGTLIIDECHHAMAMTWRRVFDALEGACGHVYGLSATPWRRGMETDALRALIGPVVEVEREDVSDAGGLCPFYVTRLDTGFQSTLDPSEHYSDAVTELTRSMDRNRTIRCQLGDDGLTLVLTDRVAHAEHLAALVDAPIITGQTRDRAAAIAGSVECGTLVATTGVLSEGFDLPAASTLILATPVRFDGALIQRVGRVLRPADGKSCAHIVDLVDSDPLFLSQWRTRKRAYEKIGAKKIDNRAAVCCSATR